MALPFVAPPDVPADRAKALQTAFMAMCKDPAFLDDAQKLGLDISPIDGAAIDKLLTRAAATPKDVIDRFNASRRNRPSTSKEMQRTLLTSPRLRGEVAGEGGRVRHAASQTVRTPAPRPFASRERIA